MRRLGNGPGWTVVAVIPIGDLAWAKRDVILPGFLASYGKHDGLGYWAAEARTTGAFVGWFGLHPGTPPTPGGTRGGTSSGTRR